MRCNKRMTTVVLSCRSGFVGGSRTGSLGAQYVQLESDSQIRTSQSLINIVIRMNEQKVKEWAGGASSR